MQTLVLTPTEVFFLPQRLLVPLFQRPYVWSRDAQWVLLWDDIRRQAEQRLKNTGEVASHFLGRWCSRTSRLWRGNCRGEPSSTVSSASQPFSSLWTPLTG